MGWHLNENNKGKQKPIDVNNKPRETIPSHGQTSRPPTCLDTFGGSAKSACKYCVWLDGGLGVFLDRAEDMSKVQSEGNANNNLNAVSYPIRNIQQNNSITCSLPNFSRLKSQGLKANTIQSQPCVHVLKPLRSRLGNYKQSTNNYELTQKTTTTIFRATSNWHLESER